MEAKLIRRLSDFFRGGHYEHRIQWSRKHICRLPKEGLFSSLVIGTIWRCKCGKRYECWPARIAPHKDWKEIEDVQENI